METNGKIYGLDHAVSFRKALIKQLVEEINRLSFCEKPIVTEFELTIFINDYNDDLTAEKQRLVQKYGANHMEDVLFWLVDYCKCIYFEDIIKYIHYDRITSVIENKTIKD